MADNKPSPVQLVFDTNILVDALLARGPYFQYAVQLLEQVRDGLVEGWVAPHCVTTVYYLIERVLARETHSRKESDRLARALLNHIMQFLKPLPQVGNEWLELDAESGEDLEDQLIVALTQAYLPNPLVITRDKGFLKSKVFAAHPKEIIDRSLHLKKSESATTPFIDLAAQQRIIRPSLQKGIHKVLQHGQYIMGPEITELEHRLAEYVGVRHAIGCSSGTDALLLALLAHGVGTGDAIFTTPFTFIATAEVISLLGATPVFVDIDPKTFNIDPGKLKQAVTALKSNDPSLHPLPSNHNPSPLTPKGVIPVDLFGLPADYDNIRSIAQEHGLFIIEDAAQSFGAQYNGKKACAFGDLACTSFFPAKPLGGYGDGGMCFTDDDEKAEILRSLLVHGKGFHKYDNARIGINGRLDTLQAAILLAKFDILPKEIELRKQVAQRYTELLMHLSSSGAVLLPQMPRGLTSAWAQYSILAKDEDRRATIQTRLKEAGIPTAIYYPKPLHLQSAFKSLEYKKGNFQISEDYAGRIFSLPMHPYLTGEEQEKIAEIIAHA